MKGLKETLDRFYREYRFEERLLHDPIEFPLRYKDPKDIEVVAFIAASFAYGRVGLFKAVVEKVLAAMGQSPYNFLAAFNLKKDAKAFKGLRYRFNRNEDIVGFLFVVHSMLREYTSLEKTFEQFYSNDHIDIGSALSGFMNKLTAVDTSVIYGDNIKPPGLRQFFPAPENGSACKRANLFLRWMIRDRDIDFGIWKSVPKGKLIIPLDTHIAKISKCLGFTQRKAQDWKMAEEITAALREIDPEDPVKYDFALCHLGISGMCGGRSGQTCEGCIFNK